LSSTFASNFLRQQDHSSSSFIHWKGQLYVLPGMCESSSTITSVDDVGVQPMDYRAQIWTMSSK
jgi:hypothetical protein